MSTTCQTVNSSFLTSSNGAFSANENRNKNEGQGRGRKANQQDETQSIMPPSSITMEVPKDSPTENGILAEDGSADPSEDIPPSCNYCTFAVTGPNPSWQPILICHDCVNENEDQENPLCICQACAEICHDGDDHDVEYIGMGPSYCDCDCIGNCSIFSKSLKEAERLGMSSTRMLESPSDATAEKEVDKDGGIMSNVFCIPTLQGSDISSSLVQHAQELVKHSKETHWVDKNCNLDGLSPLEKLSWNLFEHHAKQFGSALGDVMDRGGAEWWVQVKDTSGQNTAIDLHYDKDEALAESFALGSFPTLSTVTYLTESSSNAAPTIVFDHTYSQGEEDVMSSMLVSRPKLGKHLVFDGSLLHGAPAHALLKGKKTMDDEGPSIRVTFLVNIWKDRRPASVLPLDEAIRQKLNCLNAISLEDPLIMTIESVSSIALQKEQDILEQLRHRIELPFVTKGITWEDQLNVSKGDDEDDGGSGLVVVTFPPPPTDHDTLLVSFGPGLQAYMDYVSEDKDPDASKDKEQESGYV